MEEWARAVIGGISGGLSLALVAGVWGVYHERKQAAKEKAARERRGKA